MPRLSARFPRFPRLLLAAGLGLFLAQIARAQDTVKASFNPTQIAAGRQGYYRLEFSFNPTGMSGTVPVPDSLVLDLRSPGVSTSINMNGATNTVSVTYSYRVTASRPGQFTIPSYQLDVGGKKVTVSAATLEVTEKPVTPAGLPGDDDACVLTATVPRKDLYIGEKFPLDISLIRLAGVAVNPSQIQQDGDGFDHVRLYNDWDRSEFASNGRNYASDTWHFAITALKSGEQKLVFTMPAQVMMASGVLPMNDPMLAQFFGRTFGQQQTVNIQSAPLVLNVQPLPAEGRPANFSGAIGNFTAGEPQLSSTSLQVGVPVTLKIAVSGRGNFDALHPPPFEATSQWRSYAPKDSFEASDRTGYRGVKTLEYVLIPMSENITELMPPEISFFDPEKKQYIELPVRPIAVTVKPAAPGQAPAPLPAVAGASSNSQKTELVGLHLESGEISPSKPPLFLSPYFLAAQVLPAVVLGALLVTRRRQLRLENDPVYARRLRARKEARAAATRARAAASAGKAAEFYATAQRALQEAASHDRANAAEALTWQEFDAHLTARGTSAAIRDQAKEIFEAGDALRFGGFAPDQAALSATAARLDTLVEQLLRRS